MWTSVIFNSKNGILSILGCHFGPNMPYTSKNVNFCDFQLQKWNFHGICDAILDQIRRTHLKKWISVNFVSKSEIFMEFGMTIWTKYTVHVSKSWNSIIFIKFHGFLVFIWIARKPSTLNSKIPSKSRRLFTSGSWKSKNENVATFLDVYDVFGSKFCHFSHFTRKMKVIQLFKAKR